MSSQEYEKLLDDLSKITDSNERSLVSYVALGRIAAGIENHEPGYERIVTPMGEVWAGAGERFNRILEKNPEEALEIAVQLTTLPISPVKKVEDINKWIRGDGPSMLGREELRKNLLNYLDKPDKSGKLIYVVTKNISFDFSGIRESNQAVEDPDCYLSLATLLFGMKLKGDIDTNENAKKIFEQAKAKLESPDVTRVIDYYGEQEDTKWLADELKSRISI